MDFDFISERDASVEADSVVRIVLISGTCCNPSLEAADERSRRVIEEAAAEVGVEVRIEMMTMTSAYYSAPKDVKKRPLGEFAGGGLSMPAILIGGKAVSYGVPSLEVMKAALLAASIQKKEHENE